MEKMSNKIAQSNGRWGRPFAGWEHEEKDLFKWEIGNCAPSRSSIFGKFASHLLVDQGSGGLGVVGKSDAA